MSLLDTVQTPDDVRALPEAQLEQLCIDVRDRIIDVVSRHKGAHFGSNLGTVELTVALHRAFDTPRPSSAPWARWWSTSPCARTTP